MKAIIITSGLLFALNFLVLPLFENRLIYFPAQSKEMEYDLDYQDIYLKTEDGEQINAWYMENSQSDKVVLFFHGNAGDICLRIPIIKQLLSMNVSVFMPDYHGFGKSTGAPSEKHLYMDASACYKYLTEEKQYSPENIYLFGRSLGGAVAIDLAARRKTGGLIVESSFTRIKDFVPVFLKPFIRLRHKYNSVDKIKNVKTKKLFIHSKEDDVVPYWMGKHLYESAAAPKQFLSFSSWKHSDVIDEIKYTGSIKNFIHD